MLEHKSSGQCYIYAQTQTITYAHKILPYAYAHTILPYAYAYNMHILASMSMHIYFKYNFRKFSKVQYETYDFVW